MTALIIICIVVLSALLYLFFISPAARPREMSGFLKEPIAHRGMHDDDGVAENSISAFALAIEKGYPIEIDVRVTKDEDVYVVHDNGLRRLCGIESAVSDLTGEEMSRLSLSEGGEKIPTLKETLDFVNGRVPLLIELKGENSSTIAERSYEILKDYSGTYAIQSFNPYLIARYRRLTKKIPIGILAEKSGRRKLKDKIVSFLLSHIAFNFMYRPDFVSYKHTDKLPVSAKICKLFGAHMLCWTVREKDALERVRGDYDGFICENIKNLY